MEKPVPGKIAREVAKETGVNEKTIRRDAAFVEALDILLVRSIWDPWVPNPHLP